MPMEKLRQQLKTINGKGYKAYKLLQGNYQFDDYNLSIDHVQGDAFAEPSRLSLFVPMSLAGFPSQLWNQSIRKIALEDYIARRFAQAILNYCPGNRGSGSSGEIHIACSGQQIIKRNAVLFHSTSIELRFVLGLPAKGRRIDSHIAEQMFFTELPQLVNHSLFYHNLDQRELQSHLNSTEDQEFLRNSLADKQLVAFIANGARLPRQSGISDLPLRNQCITFQSPATYEHEIELPHAGKVQGMGIPKGVSLIIGGGFHGKSTLLQALEYGIYNHIPGDGREQVVCEASAVKIRAEDGRTINQLDISPFINNLPLGKDTHNFSTENASGSTSQAANIIEALHCESKLLLIDEDTSATNFMIRDQRMQSLVKQAKEPITPLVQRIQHLAQQHQVSTILVMGGSGDYLDIADHVIMMDNYNPIDMTQQAKNLSSSSPNTITDLGKNHKFPPFHLNSIRKPIPGSLNPAWQQKAVKIQAKVISPLWYGQFQIDLNQVEQLVNADQTRTIGLMIYYYEQYYATSSKSLIEGLKSVLAIAENQGLDSFSNYKIGNLAMPRLYELAAAINRFRNIHWQ